MAESLTQAREAIERAADLTEGDVRTQLLSIVEGLDELTGQDKTQDVEQPHADRVAELEEKLGGLADEPGLPDGAADQAERALANLRSYRETELEG